MYRMLRIFCATSWELEGERLAFYDVIGQFNEAEGLKAGVLYVPVSLTNAPDKRPYQYTINENIQACRHYIVALDEDWGPKERNFERDYRLALECAANTALPMKQTAILVRTLPDGARSPFTAALADAGFQAIDFTGTDDFKRIVLGLLGEWFPADASEESTSGASA